MPEPISVDMTKATTMEPLPVDVPYLCALSKLLPGTSGSGGRKVDVELTVLKPETTGVKGRKFFDSINLDNEFTLGRLLNLLKALGLTEDDIRKPDFELAPDDLLGGQVTVFAGIRESEQYGDKNTIRRVRPAASYAEVVGK